MRTLPVQLWFLRDEYLLKVQDVVCLPQDALHSLMQVAGVMRADHNLARLAWHCHYLLFECSDDIIPWTFYTPSLSEYMGVQASLFIVVVLCSGFRRTMENCDNRGIPRQVMVDTFSDLSLWMNHYYEKYGLWGLETMWLYYHFSGRCYRLGRLQFVLDLFRGDVRAFRHRASKRVVALAEPGIQFRGDGQVDGTNGVFDSDDVWTSTLEVNDGTIQGFKVSPTGAATKQYLTLSLNEWEVGLQRGEQVLDIHVPEGEPLDPERCRESFCSADKFFHMYFPEFDYRAYTCRTWLFDNQFQQLLPPTSNIVRFQREFYLYPLVGAGSSLERIFGTSDLSHAATNTLLQRAVFGHLLSGNYIRDMGGFILKDDVAWGTEIYQSGERSYV